MRVLILAALLIMASGYAFGADPRFCGEPVRDPDGTIHRSGAVLRAFQKLHPCPSTGLPTGACPGWSKDHVIPLDCGGCDAVGNLQWLPNDIKSAAGTHAKDRFERKIYYPSVATPGTENCIFEVVK